MSGSGVPQPALAPGIGPTLQLASLDADEFEIVDCVLPAQIRRLGRHVTFLGARRPIRTTGRDCAIRGGEYVAYDRANYATALKIWLPFANQGDPIAQTYVGDIYEKGLGRTPDYAVAADWYRRAAEQGYATAQISLGQLFERGLGVPKDMVAAMNLYRQASGLGAEFEMVVAAELRTLQVELDESSRNAEIRGRQVESLQRDLQEAHHQLQELREEAEAERQSLALARREIAARREALAAAPKPSEAEPGDRHDQPPPARQAEVQTEGEAALARRSEELDRRVAEISAREAQHRQEAAAELDSIRAAHREIEVARREFAQQRANLDAEIRRLELQRERVAEAQTAQARQIEAQEAELRELHATLEEREHALAQRSEELDRRVAEVSAREAEQQANAAAAIDKIETARRELKSARREVTEQTARLDTEARQMELQRERATDEQAAQLHRVEAQRVELQRLEATLAEREAALVRRELGIKQKENEIAELNQQSQERPGQPPAEESLINFGNYYALVIGNNEYQSNQGMPALSSPRSDAEAISALLAQKYGYTVIPLINANRDQILEGLNTLRATLKEEDNLLIYYAGHGTFDEESGHGYWLPVDAEPYPHTSKWISAGEITDILNSMRAKHVLVVADSCYGGTLTASDSSQFGLGVPQEERYYWLKTIANRPARMALTSGSLSPVLDGGGGQHSIFAMALLEVLGTNSDVMEGWRVYLRVSARVSDIAQVYGLKQVPTYGAIKSEKYAGGDFLFVRS